MKLPKMPSFRLDNKRALIVGSSSGIGIGCATALADAGASVYWLHEERIYWMT